MTRKKYILIFIFIIIAIGAYVIISYFARGPQVFESQPIPQVELDRDREYLVEVWAENLNTPWGMVFIDDDTILVTERRGIIQIIENGLVREDPYMIIDDVDESGEGGLMGIDIHPDFPEKPYVYVMYTSPTDNRIARIIHDEEAQTGTLDRVILSGLDKARNHNGGRLKFGPDGYLYATTGEQFRAERSQDIASLSGKILRMTDGGEVPADNPFKNVVYSYGHRNAQGLAWDGKGNMFASEHGPSGEFGIFAHDEINQIFKGENYGWPRVVGQADDSRYVDPLIVWTDTAVPPAGIAFAEGVLYVATLRSRALYEIHFDAKNNVKHVGIVFEGESGEGGYGRLRDAIFHNGALYVATSNRDGRGNPIEVDDRILKITW